jgi:hypothetical protein
VSKASDVLQRAGFPPRRRMSAVKFAELSREADRGVLRFLLRFAAQAVALILLREPLRRLIAQ